MGIINLTSCQLFLPGNNGKPESIYSYNEYSMWIIEIIAYEIWASNVIIFRNKLIILNIGYKEAIWGGETLI